ncbi:MAG: membrane protein insertion efficiency factor YidD [Deltaproteobacteria bacterium]|nr:membrane protein insertion efficiency factor YidD [Deltaproteobacteria bacterium]
MTHVHDEHCAHAEPEKPSPETSGSETAEQNKSSPWWKRLLAWPFLKFIRFYQRFLSPLKPPTCRYFPSCSAYAHSAVTQHGPVKGGYLASTRILRCSPLFPGGFDPVPESAQEKRLLAEGKSLVETKERKNRLGSAVLDA